MRDELARQLGRRRTQLLLAAMVVVPLLVLAPYLVRGAPELTPGATPQLQHLAAGSGLAFAVFVLWLCAPLLLVAIAAAFGGDGLAAEASWGTLRYLLVAPVPRRTLLVRKLGSALVLATLATLLLTGTSLLAGTLAFGWHGLDTPVGGALDPAAGSARLVLATAYVLVTLLPFLTLALLGATIVETPLAAVGLAIGVAVLSQLLDVVEALGDARAVLPTHYALAWTDLFVDPPRADDLARGALQAALITVASCAAAWWRFARRDVTS